MLIIPLIFLLTVPPPPISFVYRFVCLFGHLCKWDRSACIPPRLALSPTFALQHSPACAAAAGSLPALRSIPGWGCGPIYHSPVDRHGVISRLGQMVLVHILWCSRVQVPLGYNSRSGIAGLWQMHVSNLQNNDFPRNYWLVSKVNLHDSALCFATAEDGNSTSAPDLGIIGLLNV